MDKTTVTDGEFGPETLAAMQRFLEGHAETPSRARRWLPIVFVSIVILAILVGLSLGIKTLVGDRGAAPAPEPTLEPVEYTAPVGAQSYDPPPELDAYGNPIPQRVPVDIGVYPAEPGTCSTLTLPRMDPFCGNLSDRALSDRDVANYLVSNAAYHAGSTSLDARASDKDAIHWLRQVVATPAEDGGPSLENEAEYLAILDRWLADDYSQAHEEWAWFRSVLD